MRKIDPQKLTHELIDTLIHRECVQRSGLYLATELKKLQKGADSTSLICRCQTHDLSKMNNVEEFLALASIVDNIDELQDIHYEPTPEVQRATLLHGKNNDHHFGFFEDPNDMNTDQATEQVVDCHARSKQFGTEGAAAYLDILCKKVNLCKSNYDRTMRFAELIDKLAKDDDYQDIINQKMDVGFNFDDRMVSCLENFNIDNFTECITTDRLFMFQKMNTDFATICYELRLKENNSFIGYIKIKAYGEIDYKIYQNYKEQGFLLEGLIGLLSICDMNYLYCKIKKTNTTAQRCFDMLGFAREELDDTTYKYTTRNLDEVKRLCLKA